MRRTALWLLASSVWLGACSGGGTIESPPLTRHPVLAEPVDVVVQYGHDELVPGTDMDVGLVGVFSDYRCPANATCGWQGSAVVGLHIALGSDPGAVFFLNTGVDPRSLALGHYLITVTGLTPQRTAGDSIPARKYQVGLRVESI
jgi:hypothetical protein